MKIKVLVKEPGKKPVITDIENTLEAFQETVGGYIETVTLASDLVIICNEEGRIFDLPYNCRILNVDFVGTIIICGVDGENFADIPIGYNTAKQMFPKLWEGDTV